MVFIQHLARVADLQVVVAALLPRQADHPIQVGLDHAILGRLDRHLTHAVQLAHGLLLRLFRHAGRVDTLLHLRDLGLLLVPLAQFLLNRLELLAQVEIALHLLHLAHGLGLDLAAQLQNLQLLGQQRAQLAQLLADAVDLQQFLRGVDLQPQAGSDQIDQLARVLDVDRGHLQLFGQVRHQVDELTELLLRIARQCLQLHRVLQQVRHLDHIGPQVGLHLGIIFNPDALQTLDDQAHSAIRRAQHAMDYSQGADVEDLVRIRLVAFWILAGKQADDARLSLGQRLIDQAHRTRLAHSQWQPHHRIDHHTPQRKNGQVLRARVQVSHLICLVLVEPCSRSRLFLVPTFAK